MIRGVCAGGSEKISLSAPPPFISLLRTEILEKVFLIQG